MEFMLVPSSATWQCTHLYLSRTLGRAQLLKSLWKPFDIGFQDIEGALQSQQKLVDYEIRLASEEAAFEQRRKENMFREQGIRHQEFEIQQWDHSKKWIQKLEQRAKCMYLQLEAPPPKEIIP